MAPCTTTWNEHVHLAALAISVIQHHDRDRDQPTVANALRQLEAAVQCMRAELAVIPGPER